MLFEGKTWREMKAEAGAEREKGEGGERDTHAHTNGWTKKGDIS